MLEQSTTSSFQLKSLKQEKGPPGPFSFALKNKTSAKTKELNP